MSGLRDFLRVGQEITAKTGSRWVTVRVEKITDYRVTLLCLRDWSFQNGNTFDVDTDKFGGTIWAKALAGAESGPVLGARQ